VLIAVVNVFYNNHIHYLKQKEKKRSVGIRLFGGFLFLILCPVIAFTFVGLKLVPISFETFFGAWLGALLAFVTMKGYGILFGEEKK
jgi:hypothetical protein